MNPVELDIKDYFAILSEGKSLIFIWVPSEYLLDRFSVLTDKLGVEGAMDSMRHSCKEMFGFDISFRPFDKGVDFMDFVLWDYAIVECENVEELAETIMDMYRDGRDLYYAQAWHDGKFFDENT